MNSRTIQQQTNERIYARNVPPVTLDNPISFRPVITRYTIVPKPLPMPYTGNNDPPFSVSTTFNPGDRQSPWIGYKNAIDAESTLRDQLTNLGAQKKYVPNIMGDLYNVSVASTHSGNGIVDFPHLFIEPTFGPFNPGDGIQVKYNFYNSSRTNKPI